ncbi:dienelactone hydrolase family protein [Nannocystaceae bacterium ST9]
MPDIQLTTSDAHTLSAHRVDPLGSARGGVVVIQEIFGVNAHIRAVVARFAAAGYTTLAPAFFDRVERGVQLGYDQQGFGRGREIVGQLEPAGVLADLGAAVELLHGENLPVAIVGYCWGGAVVWSAAHRMTTLACAISYYGSRIVGMVDDRPNVPLMMHVGRHDASLPLAKVHAIGERYGQIAIHEYDAGHGFDCDHRGDFDSTASAHAMMRSLAFIAEHMPERR